MARIAVVGPGSVGVFFAGHLAEAGHDVIACARRPFDRYVIESTEFPLDIEAAVVTDPSDIDASVEWVLVCVKAHQTEGAADWLAALCDQDTRVLVVQNGIEHHRVDPFVNGAPSIPAVVYCGAELVAPGRIAHLTSGRLIVPAEPFGKELAELFAESQAELRPSDNFVTHQWRKLSMNIMANGLTALTRRRMGVVAEPGIRPIAVALVRECWELARAEGANLDPDNVEEVIETLIAGGRDGGTSMFYDTLAGRPTEHDAIHGAALRCADRLGIDTPTIRIIHGLLDARTPTS